MLIHFPTLIARARESGNGDSPLLDTLGDLATRSADGTFLETRQAVVALEAARETLDALEEAVIHCERETASAADTTALIAVLEG